MAQSPTRGGSVTTTHHMKQGSQRRFDPAVLTASTGRRIAMHFGKHTATSVEDRGTPSAIQAFTRGTLVGGGKQWRFKFANGFGASVINDGYGRESGRFELAVLGPDDHLTYDTPITDDVLGFLAEDEVADALDRIEALSAADVEGEIARKADAARDERIAQLRAELSALEAEVSA